VSYPRGRGVFLQGNPLNPEGYGMSASRHEEPDARPSPPFFRYKESVLPDIPGRTLDLAAVSSVYTV